MFDVYTIDCDSPSYSDKSPWSILDVAEKEEIHWQHVRHAIPVLRHSALQ